MNPFSLILIFLTLAGLGYYLKRQPANQRGRALLVIIAATVLFLLVYLAFTRRLYLLGAALAFMLPFLKRLLPALLRGLPFFVAWRKRKQAKQQPPPNNQSKVQSALLEMVLDHDTGTMTGRVLQGPMEGRELEELSDEEFIELLQYCREQDGESARLLETYLDRRFGESWRRDDPGAAQEDTQSHENGPITDAEAYDILGLTPGASREEIIQAHRRLMQRMHPDRGGSQYLAARLNAARSHLLKD